MSETLPEERNAEHLREFSDQITRAIVAYANTDGGVIYVGVDEFGVVAGASNAEEIVSRIGTLARERVTPSAEELVDAEIVVRNGKKTVEARVSRGVSRPYFLSDKGLTPSGVLIRERERIVPSSPSTLRRLLSETSDGSFESTRSVAQNLTFTYASKVFERANVPFDRDRFFELGLYDASGLYTNLALLLSDQAPSTLKLALFEGTQENQLHERGELSGSIFQQYEDAYAHLDRLNRAHAQLHAANRGDFRDYPPEILREALLNAIVHRDYAKSAKTLVRCYHDRVEIVSCGGLPFDLTFDEALLGVSAPRNPKLADIFYQLQLIETSGVGIAKIRQAYANYASKPTFEASPNFFKVTLRRALGRLEKKVAQERVRVARYSPVKFAVDPNLDEERPPVKRVATISGVDSLSVASRDLCVAPTTTATPRVTLSDRERRVLKMFNSRESLTCRDVETALNLTQASAAAILRRLVNSGRIVLCGAGTNIWYRRP